MPAMSVEAALSAVRRMLFDVRGHTADDGVDDAVAAMDELGSNLLAARTVAGYLVLMVNIVNKPVADLMHAYFVGSASDECDRAPDDAVAMDIDPPDGMPPTDGTPTAQGLVAQRPAGAPPRRCILIHRTKCTPQASKDVAALAAHGVDVERFSMDEMIDDPLLSCMAATYRRLTADEVAAIEDRYGSIDRLPLLLTMDPVCRRFNPPIGAVYEIVYHTGLEEVVYRVVGEPRS